MKNAPSYIISLLPATITLMVGLLSPQLALAETYTNDIYVNDRGNTYQDTCKDAKAYAAKPKAARATIMTAKCKADDGTWKKSSINLDLCTGAMSNYNGQLTCQPFQETCSNVNMRYEYVPVRPDAAGTGTIGPSYNRYLTATCLKDDGSKVNIDVDMFAIEGVKQGKSVLRNVDGIIQAECPSGKSLKPNGGNMRCK